MFFRCVGAALSGVARDLPFLQGPVQKTWATRSSATCRASSTTGTSTVAATEFSQRQLVVIWLSQRRTRSRQKPRVPVPGCQGQARARQDGGVSPFWTHEHRCALHAGVEIHRNHLGYFADVPSPPVDHRARRLSQPAAAVPRLRLQCRGGQFATQGAQRTEKRIPTLSLPSTSSSPTSVTARPILET